MLFFVVSLCYLDSRPHICNVREPSCSINWIIFLFPFHKVQKFVHRWQFSQHISSYTFFKN